VHTSLPQLEMRGKCRGIITAVIKQLPLPPECALLQIPLKAELITGGLEIILDALTAFALSTHRLPNLLTGRLICCVSVGFFLPRALAACMSVDKWHTKTYTHQ